MEFREGNVVELSTPNRAEKNKARNFFTEGTESHHLAPTCPSLGAERERAKTTMHSRYSNASAWFVWSPESKSWEMTRLKGTTCYAEI